MKILFCTDLHLREDKPICRLDQDWIDTQKKQIEFISQTASAEQVDAVLIGGDLFHRSQVPDFIKNMVISVFSEIPAAIYAIAGQHDLPYHSFDRINQSSFGVLRNTKVILDPSFCSFAHYGQGKNGTSDMVVIHESIFPSYKDVPPGMKAKVASEIFEEYSEKWILSGDIHHGFHIKLKDRHLIMGGCMNRQASDMIDYEPVVWIIDTSTDEVRSIPIPDDVNMVTDNHIQEREEREDRIAAFIKLVKDSKSVSLDFDKNVEEAIRMTPEMAKGVKEKIQNLMERA